MNLAGWAEVLLIALLAFVIIGPKDLPKVLFMIGRLIQNIRRLSNEFMSEFEELNYMHDSEERKKNHQKRPLD